MRSRKNSVNEDFLAEYKAMKDKREEGSNKISYKESGSRRDRRKKEEELLRQRRSIDKKNKKLEDDYKKKQKKIAKKTRKRKRRKWPYVIVILLLLISAALALGYSFLDSQMDKFNKVDTESEKFGISTEAQDRLKDYENYAILGLDARSWGDPKLSRSDSIIIVSLNKKTGEINLASVMRDTNLLMKDLQGEDYFDKAAHSYFYGGAVNTVTMLNKNLDLNIDKFLVFNWQAVADMVDAAGGVEIDVKEEELFDLNRFMEETAINLKSKVKRVEKAGKQTLNGVQTVTYCRIRETSGSDTARTARTKMVIEALFNKVKKNPMLIPEITDKSFPSIITNIKTSDVLDLLPKIFKLNMKSSYAYPKYYWYGIEGEAWIILPTDLEENAKYLHSKLFKDVKYEPSEQIKKIDRRIINIYGIRENIAIDFE